MKQNESIVMYALFTLIFLAILRNQRSTPLNNAEMSTNRDPTNRSSWQCQGLALRWSKTMIDQPNNENNYARGIFTSV